MAEEFDFHPMWESLGMNLADHDMLLGAVGQMYGDMFLTQNNRPKSTSYLDFVATNIHSGRIKEMLDKKEDLTRALINRENGVIITIGNENKEEAMQDCSLITATYHVDGKLMGKIGVIGPTRMDYSKVIQAVRAASAALGES